MEINAFLWGDYKTKTMKTKLILLLMISISVGTNAQINKADSTVQAITYWNLNESYTYEFIQGKNKSEGGESSMDNSLRSILQVTVIDSTETSYTIEWRFLKHDIPGIDQIPELKNLLNDKKYVYRTNEIGEFEELLNWEEVRDNTLATTRASLSMAFQGRNEAEADSLINSTYTMMESMMTKEYIEQKVIEPVSIFHSFFGGVYGLDEVIETDIDIAIPAFNLGNTTARVKIWLDEIDFEDDIYTICFEQKIAQEQIKKIMEQFFGELSQNLNIENSNKEGLNDVLSAEWDYSVVVYVVFDNSGWPLDIVSKSNISVGEGVQNKTLQIRMINDYD